MPEQDFDERGQPYTLNSLSYLLDHRRIVDRDAYNPTETDLADPIFDALWSVMRLQEVLLPGNLRSGATGNDVMIVLKPLRERLRGTVASADDLRPRLEQIIQGWRKSADGVERELSTIRKDHPEGPRYGIEAVRHCADDIEAALAGRAPV